MIYGLKCLTAEAIDKASISHGIHFCWFDLSLALKYAASFGWLLACETERVAPSSLVLSAPSFSVQSRADRAGEG